MNGDNEPRENTTAHWVESLNAAEVPCGLIYSVDQMFENAKVKQLGLAQDVPNEQNQKITLVGRHAFHTVPHAEKMAARSLEFGEETQEVLEEFGGSRRDVRSKRDRIV